MAVVVQRATVVGVHGQNVTVVGATWCPSNTWCGQTLDSLDVGFPIGLPVAQYGDVLDIYGHVIGGGLAPVAVTVTGHCDPEWDC